MGSGSCVQFRPRSSANRPVVCPSLTPSPQVEAERVMVVLQESIGKLNQLLVIPKEHNSTIVRELKLQGDKGSAAAVSDLWAAESCNGSIARKQTRDLLRHMHQKPALVETLTDYADLQRPSAMQPLIEALEDLKVASAPSPGASSRLPSWATRSS